MIYLDNAATSWPKPYSVVCAVRDGLTSYAANPGRGGYKMAIQTAEKVYETRARAAKLFNAPEPQSVVFTQNCTAAINIALKCFLPRGAHVVVSDREHNSVMRPLYAMAAGGRISYDVASIGDDVDNADAYFARKINQNTVMLLCTHISNVTGEIMPIGKLGRLAAKFGLLFTVDAAQSAGAASIDMARDFINLLCLPGHKGLCGPSGSGMLIIRDTAPVASLVEGGTGSESQSLRQPDFLPDMLESGTLPVASVLGLGEGLKFVSELGQENIAAHEAGLRAEARSELSALPGVMIYEPAHPTSILLFNLEGVDCEKVAAHLDSDGIAVRSGLHCSPSAHEVNGTLKTGAVRASFGIFNEAAQASRLAASVKRLIHKL